MTTPTRRPDASMTLLTEMMQRPLDPGYAAAAQRRTASGLTPSTGHRGTLVVGACIVIGLLFAVSALALRVPQTTASRAKAQLIDQIDTRRAQSERQTARVASLRAEIDAAQAAALRVQSRQGLATALQRAEFVTGAAAATGPGLVLTMDDAKDTGSDSNVDPRNAAAADQGRVLARDLQIVVNGLWHAGAEAISINGQRLTARAAIRFAGQAILVDYRPLTRPYVITAIGSESALPADFAAGDGGSYLQSLKTNFGIRGDVVSRSSVTVPGEPSLSIRAATPVLAGTPGPSAGTSTAPKPSETTP